MNYEDYFIEGNCRCPPERGDKVRSLPENQLAELAAWTLLYSYQLTDKDELNDFVPYWATGIIELSSSERIKLVKALIELIEFKYQLRSQSTSSPTRPEGFF